MDQHGVVFYHSDRTFTDTIVEFGARALEAGDPLVLVTTHEHMTLIRGGLARRGFHWDTICDHAGGAFYDAHTILGSFMVDGVPDATRFHRAMESVLAPWAGMSERWRVRVFGEMVDLLFQAGQGAAALTLEGLWNDLARNHRFSLLCAYSMGNFYREVNGAAYKRVCELHDHLVPSPDHSGERAPHEGIMPPADLDGGARPALL
jgi:hypothetical protein